MTENKAKMIKFTKSEHCIEIQSIVLDSTKQGEIQKSSHFYYLKEEIDKITECEEGRVLAKDGYSFAVLRKYDNKLHFEITWLDGYSSTKGNSIVKGKVEYFTVDFEPFYNWYLETEDSTLRLLDRENVRPNAVIEYRGRKNLIEILSTPLVKRKFIKQIMDLKERAEFCKCDKIYLHDDWVQYSFEWSRFIGTKRDMNGGLIFHKDYDNPTDLSKGKYGIHT